ncbi:MAG: glycerophosphodiester phosphodiesterase, partial [Promethearchaeota archaeon]
LAVLHDRTLDRLFSVKKKVRKMKWDKISSIRSVAGNQGVPRLDRVIDTFSGEIKLMIELKGRGTAVPVIELLKHKNYDQAVISSRDLGMLREANLKAKEIGVAIQICLNITSCKAFSLADLLDSTSIEEIPVKFDMISLRSTLVDAPYIEKCHELGIKALCWDFLSPENPLDVANKLVAMGIDGFLFDDPEMVKEFVEN